MGWVYHISNKASSMTQNEMEANATEIYNQLTGYGWTLNAICGVLGNMEIESYLNPAQWQIGYDIGQPEAGYGLVQFTPSTKFTNWAEDNSHSITDGFWQIYGIDKQPWGTEYIPTEKYPLSYAEYKSSEESIEYLTEAFLLNYERPYSTQGLAQRIERGRWWYEYLTGVTPPEPPTPPTPSKGKHKMPLYMYPVFRY